MAQNKIVISEVMMPSQANPNGNVHGGEIMKMMDSTAYAAARKYARSIVVTARVENLADERYQQVLGYGEPGRTGYLGIRLRY